MWENTAKIRFVNFISYISYNNIAFKCFSSFFLIFLRIRKFRNINKLHLLRDYPRYLRYSLVFSSNLWNVSDNPRYSVLRYSQELPGYPRVFFGNSLNIFLKLNV